MTWDRRTSAAVSRSRRQFIREATGACLGTAMLSSRAKGQAQRNRKAVIVTFGGGARDDETFMPSGHENIPHLLKELLPQATSLLRSSIEEFSATTSRTRAWRRAPTRRSTISLLRRPQHPTVFEYLRKGLNRPSSDAWS